ncbi:MAG: hypothetical protein QOJ89_1528 [bacterium]
MSASDLAAGSVLAEPSVLTPAPPLADAPALAQGARLERRVPRPPASQPQREPATSDERPPAGRSDSGRLTGLRLLEPARAGSGRLTGLRLLLDRLDALLRDPTLSLWLKAALAKLAAGVRAGAAAALDALKRLRLPRPLLLGLLALLPALVLLALLTGGDDEPARPGAARPQAAAGASLPGVAMPDLRAADVRPRPVRVALVLDRSYPPAELRRELRALGAWLGEHHAAGTRVTIIDAASAHASAALRASELAAGRPLRARASTPAAIRAALGRPQDRRLLVTLGSTAPPLPSASTLTITARRGAAASAPSRTGRRSRAAIDERRPNALAATVAREIMALSGQRERR